MKANVLADTVAAQRALAPRANCNHAACLGDYTEQVEGLAI